jgi:hypothetical protein
MDLPNGNPYVPCLEGEALQMTQLSDLGVLGLAVMGANLARNAARKGFGVALYNRHGGRTDDLMRDFGHEGRFTPTKDLKSFVAAMAKPRVVVIMVQAGKPVDDVIDELMPYLEPDDIVIDGGNSLFTDTDRRFTSLKEKKIRFIGMGVSGGEEGALEGPSMMPGGEKDAYARIEPMVTKMAAQVDGTPCCTYIGIGGAGGLREPARSAVAALPHDALIVAVDVPSGVDADTGEVSGAAVRADVTVTFGALKAGLVVDPGAGHAGVVELVDIGLDLSGPASIEVLQAADVAGLVPRPSREWDKYRRGVLGVAAGSERYPGAAVLCSGGAIRGGAGMVRYVGADLPTDVQLVSASDRAIP